MKLSRGSGKDGGDGVCSILFAKVVSKRLFVFESPVQQHYRRRVVPAQQKALVGCDGPGNAAQPPIPNQNGWETERPADAAPPSSTSYFMMVCMLYMGQCKEESVEK